MESDVAANLGGSGRSEGCSAEVALAILAAYPEATTAMAEYDARLPLHYACQNACCPAEVVLAVLAVFPDASERMDMDGNVPLYGTTPTLHASSPHDSSPATRPPPPVRPTEERTQRDGGAGWWCHGYG